VRGEKEKFQLGRWIVVAVAIPITIISLSLPLEAVNHIARSISGQNTNFQVAISATIGISIALTASVAFTGIKLWSQRQEIKRLRKRTEDLEKLLLRKSVKT
jgi:hypothetical protein